MYPYTRSLGRPAPAISPPQSLSPRSTSQRDALSDRGSDFESLTFSDKPPAEAQGYRQTSATAEAAAAAKKDLERLNTIAQKFFTKGALAIISSRIELPQTFKRGTNEISQNKWFNLVLDHSDIVLEDVYDWALFDMVERTPPPLVIEISVDASDLGRNQTLVIVDERGEKWDVCKPGGPSHSSGSTKSQSKETRMVLERWKLEIKPTGLARGSDPSAAVYKKAIVMFRTMYFLCRLLPAWKLRRRIAKEPASLTSLKPSYRIVPGGSSQVDDYLTKSLYPSVEPTTVKHVFTPVPSPIGAFCAEVTYRSNCTLEVVNKDSLLSSHFRVMDDQHFRPSLQQQSRETAYLASGRAVGSLPSKWAATSARPELHAYGSLATYHDADKVCRTSPVSTVRAIEERASVSPSSTPPTTREPPDHRVSQSSKSSLKTAPEGAQMINRRLSVTFQPFKAGSLSSSPLVNAGSLPKTSSLSAGLQQARSRTSLTTLPQAALRIPAGASPEVAVESPSSSSPKPPPITRYSSSFSNRKSRLSFTGSAPRAEDMTSSSLRGSQSSSNRRSSDILPDQAQISSSGSLQTDDDAIADFLKLLDQKKDLQSFNRTDAVSRDASTRRTTAALTKYKGLRESHGALSESLSGSMMLHRSSSSSSRVPALIAGSSLSSASPGKPMSPHTPHTPAIPSRLSSAAIAEDFEESDHDLERDRSDRGRNAHSSQGSGGGDAAGDVRRDMSSDMGMGIPGSRPIDVPLSPQHRARHRRSSSTAYRRQVVEGLDEYGLRSASVPIREKKDIVKEAVKSPLSGALDGATMEQDTVGLEKEAKSVDVLIGAPEPSAASTAPAGSASGLHSTIPPSITRTLAPSTASFGLRSTESARGSHSSSRSGRYSFSARRPEAQRERERVSESAVDDEEPLLFTMSEVEAVRAREGSEGKV